MGGQQFGQVIVGVVFVLRGTQALGHKVRAIKPVADLVKAILDALQRNRGAGHDPALVDHPAEPVPARILIAAVAHRFRALLDVGQFSPRLG